MNPKSLPYLDTTTSLSAVPSLKHRGLGSVVVYPGDALLCQLQAKHVESGPLLLAPYNLWSEFRQTSGETLTTVETCHSAVSGFGKEEHTLDEVTYGFQSDSHATTYPTPGSFRPSITKHKA